MPARVEEMGVKTKSQFKDEFRVAKEEADRMGAKRRAAVMKAEIQAAAM